VFVDEILNVVDIEFEFVLNRQHHIQELKQKFK
jgi:hypothetical protein